MKEVELIISDEEIDKVTAMGFVEYPAIEENLIYFNKRSNYVLSKTIDSEQGLVVSPALIPEKRISRFDELTNESYNVFFSVDTVRKLAMNFLKNGYQNRVTEQHEDSVNGCFLVFSWIVENDQDPLITKYGYDVPVGTWGNIWKIENEDIKSKIKSGEIKGLSIEAYLTEKFDKHLDKNEKLIEMLREELKKLDL